MTLVHLTPEQQKSCGIEIRPGGLTATLNADTQNRRVQHPNSSEPVVNHSPDHDRPKWKMSAARRGETNPGERSLLREQTTANSKSIEGGRYTEPLRVTLQSRGLGW